MTSARDAALAKRQNDSQNTSLAIRNTTTTAQMLDRLKPILSSALPAGLDPDRMNRLIMTVVRKSEIALATGVSKHSLTECTDSSFVGCMLTINSLGLDPALGECYLIPYENRKANIVEAQLIISYKGHAKLFLQHPLARNCDAQAVHEHDEFDYAYGTNPYLRHKPAIGNRGKIIAYYGVASLANGASKFEVLTPDEVKEIRRGKVGSQGDIKDSARWMERKVALTQALKLMPRTAQMQAALEADEQPGALLFAQQVQDQRQEATDRAAITTAPALHQHPVEQVDQSTGEVMPPPAQDLPIEADYDDAAWLGQEQQA